MLKIFIKQRISRLKKIAPDTPVLLYFFRKSKKYKNFLKILFSENTKIKLVLPSIILYEIFLKIRESKAKNKPLIFKKFLEFVFHHKNIYVNNSETKIYDTASFLKYKYKIDDLYALKLGFCIEKNICFLTTKKNKNKFKKIKGLKVYSIDEFL